MFKNLVSWLESNWDLENTIFFKYNQTWEIFNESSFTDTDSKNSSPCNEIDLYNIVWLNPKSHDIENEALYKSWLLQNEI